MDIWVAARLVGDDVSATVRCRTEYDDDKHVTSEVAMAEGPVLDRLRDALIAARETTEADLKRRARFDAATMLVAQPAGDAPRKKGGRDGR